jgi:hypothetical protein
MTNKIIFLSIALALLTPLAFSQGINAGIKLGVDFPFFLGDDYNAERDTKGYDTKFMASFTGGAFLTWEVFDFLALQPEVLYTMAGGSIGSGDTREVTKIGYIEIPLLVKGTIDTGFGKLGVYVAPDLQIKVGDATRVDQNGDTIEDLDQDTFNTAVFNLVFGVDFDFPIGPGSLMLDIRYNLGITPIYNGDKLSTNRYRQNGIQLYLGYGIRIAEFSLF